MNYRYSFILLCACMLIAVVPSTTAQTISTSVLASGAMESSGGGVSMRATFGQPVVGPVSGAGNRVGQGFWYTLPAPKPNAVPGDRVDLIASSLTVMPNPASDLVRVHIPIDASGEATIVIYDGIGRAVLTRTEQRSSDHLELSLGDLPSGRYTAVLQVGEDRHAAAPLLILR